MGVGGDPGGGVANGADDCPSTGHDKPHSARPTTATRHTFISHLQPHIGLAIATIFLKPPAKNRRV